MSDNYQYASRDGTIPDQASWYLADRTASTRDFSFGRGGCSFCLVATGQTIAAGPGWHGFGAFDPFGYEASLSETPGLHASQEAGTKAGHTQAVLMSVYRTLKQRGHHPIQSITQGIESFLRTGQLPLLPHKITANG